MMMPASSLVLHRFHFFHDDENQDIKLVLPDILFPLCAFY